MHTTEETLAWAGIAAALAMVAGLYLGHRVGWRNGWRVGELHGAHIERQGQRLLRQAIEEMKQGRLAAERAKRDARGRYKKVGAP
jgi:hypothetical protein